LDGYIKATNTTNILPVHSYSLALDLQRLFIKCNNLVTITKKKNIYYIANQNKNFFLLEDGQSQFVEDKYIWSKILYIIKKQINNKNIYKIDVEDENSYIIENIII
jgi:hypothetical protein